ncbi:phage holin family protein [Pseudomonas aeruginosa]
MATENDVQQTLSDIPTWLFVLVSMAGLSGELARRGGRADGQRSAERVLLRSGASVVFGLASVLLATASGAGCRLPPRSVAWSRASAPM